MPCDDTSGSSADSTMFGNRIEECPALGVAEFVYYGRWEGAFYNNVNAPMLHCWPIGTIKVVIGRLFRRAVKLEMMSPNGTVRACPRTRPKPTDKELTASLAARIVSLQSMILLPLDNVCLAVLH